MSNLLKMMDKIKKQSDQRGKKQKELSFQKMVEDESRAVTANMFYEMLNLAKENKVVLSQKKKNFGDIEIQVVA